MNYYRLQKILKKSSEDKSLVAFLTDLALVADIDQLDEDGGKGDAVVLMTFTPQKGWNSRLFF